MSSDSLVVRFATSVDVPVIFDLIKALAEYEKLAHAVVGSAVALEEHLFGSQACIEAIVAELDQQIVGFALFFTSYSTFLTQPGIYLEDLFVLPEYRGQGVGKVLLARLAQLVVERQWGRLDWSVLDWNEPAIAFYRRIGATIAEDVRVCRLTGESLLQLAQGTALRSARLADVPALFRLVKANAEFHQSLPEVVGSLDALANHLFGNRSYAEAVVATRAEAIVGFALYFTNYSTFLTQPGLFIEDLFVEADYRGQGVGKALLTDLAQRAIERNCGRLEWLVKTWNQSAIAFYQSLGAKILPDWRMCRLASEALVTLAQHNSIKAAKN